MSERQRKWNIYEATLLLEGLLEVLNDDIPRMEIVKRVSSDLRKMALNQGEKIDETFRNVNGIYFQITSMEAAWKGHEVFGKSGSSLFSEIVDIYRLNKPEFDRLLKKAKLMVHNVQTNEANFMAWLSEKISSVHFSELEQCYTVIGSECQNAGILKEPLFGTMDPDIISEVEKYVKQDDTFRHQYFQQYNNMNSAIRYYYSYTKELADEKEGINSRELPADKRSSLEKQLQRILMEEYYNGNDGVSFSHLIRQTNYSNTIKMRHILSQADWACLRFGRYHYVKPQEENIPAENIIITNKNEKINEEPKEIPITRTKEDERLLFKYPIIYKKVFSVLLESAETGKANTINEIQKKISNIGRAADIEEILDNVSWSKNIENGYLFSLNEDFSNNANKEKEKEIIDSADHKTINDLTVDFEHLGNYMDTVPKSFSYFDESKEPCTTWKELYVTFFAVLEDDYPWNFKVGMSFTGDQNSVDLMTSDWIGCIKGLIPVPGTNFTIKTNYSASEIVRNMKFLLDICSVDYENVVIKYENQTANEGSSIPVEADKSHYSVPINNVSFYKYLIDEAGVSEELSSKYSLAVGNCENYAKEHHYQSWRLYTQDLNEAKATAQTLYNDTGFKDRNDKQTREAITMLLTFISDNDENRNEQYSADKISKESQCEESINSAEADKSRHSPSINGVSYYEYLLKVGVSKELSSLYSLTVGNCENYAKEHHYQSWRLYTQDLNEAKATAQTLYNDTRFKVRNDKQTREAITMLLAFISDNDEDEKKQFSADTISRENQNSESSISEESDKSHCSVTINGVSFYEYLINVAGVSEELSSVYSLAVENCESYAKEHHYQSWRLYTQDLNEAKTTAQTLYNYIRFKDSNNGQTREAIRMLFAFIRDSNNHKKENKPNSVGTIFKKRQNEESKILTEADEFRHSLPITGHSFCEYLQNVKGLSYEKSIRFSAAINDCEIYAKNHNFNPWKLYTKDLNEAKITVQALYNDVSYKGRKDEQLKDAISMLFAFIEGNDSTGTSKEDLLGGYEAVFSTNLDNLDRKKSYEEILREKFKKGFRLESYIDKAKLRKFYTDMYGSELEESDGEIVDSIKQICICYKNTAYLPETMLSEELKGKLLSYIDHCFDNGIGNIYFKALCTEFEEDFLGYPLYNDPEALKTYLTWVGSDRFFITRNSVSKEKNLKPDPLEEIRICLQKFDRPVKYGEIFNALPYLPQHTIKNILATNAEFINDTKGSYFHVSAVHLSNEELENIAHIIEQAIVKENFITSDDLYRAIQSKYAYIIENNSAFTIHGFRDALKYKFANRFSFNGNLISAAGRNLSVKTVFAEYAKKHSMFTLEELEILAFELGSSIYYDVVYENSLRISQQEFVSKTMASFNVADIDDVLDRVCVGDFIAIGQVENFGIFPFPGFPWNSFLLEHYVADYSNKFMLLHTSYNKEKSVGAIVRRTAGINNLDDLILHVLVDNNVNLEKGSGPVLQYLVNEGYLLVKNYKNIDKLILLARARRNKKGLN